MKNDIEEDIDKEFNENISNVFEINENDLEIEDFPSTVRDNNINNKLMNLSGISILKDLEDKWDLIEKKKFQNEDLFMRENKEEKERKGRKKMLIIQSIKKSKEDFLKNIRKLKDEYENDDFEDFVFEVFKEMEKYKELNIEANNNKQIKDLPPVNQNYQNNQLEFNNFLIQNHHLKYKQKTFLKKDPYSEIYSNSFNNNISNKESNKNKKFLNSKISTSLIGKMKNLFNDIMQPSYTTYTDNLLSNISIKVNDDISEIKKKDSFNYNEKNNEKNNVKNKNNLYSLERNFDNIYNNITPKKQKISGRNKVIVKLEKKNEPMKENKINNDSRLNDYFDKLKNKSQYKMQKYPSSNNLKINNDDIYYLNDEIKDKKFLKKLGENIQLLNRIVRINSNPNIYEKNNSYPLNKANFRNKKIEVNSSNTPKKCNNYNKIYSKNKFDITAKILKQNSFELQKFFENNPI